MGATMKVRALTSFAGESFSAGFDDVVDIDERKAAQLCHAGYAEPVDLTREQFLEKYPPEDFGRPSTATKPESEERADAASAAPARSKRGRAGSGGGG